MILLVLGALFIAPAGQAQESKPQAPPSAPPIPVGVVSREEVLRFNEEYAPRMEAYKPIASGIDFLKHYPKKIRIEVFYGAWCGDSRNHVPSFLKLIALADNPNIEVMFWAVDRTKQQPADAIKRRGIVRVPTFIVFDGDRELGRVVETPSTFIEEDLYKILEPTVLNRTS